MRKFFELIKKAVKSIFGLKTPVVTGMVAGEPVIESVEAEKLTTKEIVTLAVTPVAAIATFYFVMYANMWIVIGLALTVVLFNGFVKPVIDASVA